MDLLNTHRTIRKFTGNPVPEDLLESVIKAACRASTTGNMQLYSVIVTKEKANKDKLIPLHFNQPAAISAPVLLTVCADFNRFSKWCRFNNADPGYDNFLSFLTASIDAIILAQNICIAAEDIGLGICYLGTSTYNAKEIIEILNLPKQVFPIATLALGWPNEQPNQVDRLPLAAIVHNEVYKDYTEGDIKSLYEFKENLAESKKYVLENGKETLAQVFTDVRYTKTDNLFFSEKILQVLREQEFI